MAQAVTHITKDIAFMYSEIEKLKPIPEVVLDIPEEASELEPGEVPQCSCKRKRR